MESAMELPQQGRSQMEFGNEKNLRHLSAAKSKDRLPFDLTQLRLTLANRHPERRRETNFRSLQSIAEPQSKDLADLPGR
jgi:hypothetical protein